MLQACFSWYSWSLMECYLEKLQLDLQQQLILSRSNDAKDDIPVAPAGRDVQSKAQKQSMEWQAHCLIQNPTKRAPAGSQTLPRMSDLQKWSSDHKIVQNYSSKLAKKPAHSASNWCLPCNRGHWGEWRPWYALVIHLTYLSKCLTVLTLLQLQITSLSTNVHVILFLLQRPTTRHDANGPKRQDQLLKTLSSPARQCLDPGWEPTLIAFVQN